MNVTMADDPPADLLAALDTACVLRLRELDPAGAHGLVRRVMETFVDSLHTHLGEVQRARATADRSVLRHVSHTLKSSAASVGALDLAKVCAEVERTLRDRPDAMPDTPSLDEMVHQLRRLLTLAGRPPSVA
jgi:HPt (histidine-containing phosphotransfer) domain-containing protein